MTWTVPPLQQPSSLLRKLGFSEFAVTADAMFVDEFRLREEFQQLRMFLTIGNCW